MLIEIPVSFLQHMTVLAQSSRISCVVNQREDFQTARELGYKVGVKRSGGGL